MNHDRYEQAYQAYLGTLPEDIDPADAEMALDVFFLDLSSDGAVIIVDGKVAELEAVLARLMERDHNVDVSLTNFMDAAREVADHG